MRSLTFPVMLIFVASCAIANPANSSDPGDDEVLRLGRELETMALTASAASLIRAGRTDTALRLLEQRLNSSANSVEELVNAGVRLPPANPNLQDAPRRAAKYAAENDLTNLASRMDALYEKLK